MKISEIPPPPPMPSNYQTPATMEGGGYVRETQKQKTQYSTYQVLSLNIIQNITQFCLGGAVISALINPTIFFNVIAFRVLTQHIVLCTVGYFILMAQAVLCFSPVGWANNLQYEKQRVLHSVMQISGAVLAITGCCVLFADDRFIFLESSHSICGFVALILTILHLISGIITLIFHKNLKKLVKILHLCLGAATMIVAFISLIIAFNIYYSILMDRYNATFSIILTIFALIGTIVMYPLSTLSSEF